MSEAADRRTEERFPVSSETSCSFLSPVVEDFGPAKIKNLSMEGIGLVVGRRIEVGALLAVTLSNKAHNVSKTVLVRIVHSTPQPGGYLLGGTFNTALTYQEMTSLVM